MKNLSGFSTDQKVILAVCLTAIFIVVFIASISFVNNNIDRQQKMLAFEKCLATNIELQKLNSSNFVINNNCRL